LILTADILALIGGILLAIPALRASHLLRQAQLTKLSIEPSSGEENKKLGEKIVVAIKDLASGWSPWYHSVLVLGLASRAIR